MRTKRFAGSCLLVSVLLPGAVWAQPSGEFVVITREFSGLKHRTDIRVEADGRVEVKDRWFTHPRKHGFGTASPAELNAIRRALVQADLHSMPDDLNGGGTLPLGGESITYGLVGPQSAKRVSGHLPSIPQEIKDRLQSLDAALKAIRKRLLNPPPIPVLNVAEGIVKVRGLWPIRSVWLVSPDFNMEYKVEPWSKARKLIKFKGHYVKVGGRLTANKPRKGTVEMRTLLSPVQRPLGGRVTLGVDGPEINERMFPVSRPTPAWCPTPRPVRVRCFGKAARVLTLLVGEQVSADAWVFVNGHGKPYEARVIGVRARVTNDTDLTRRTAVVNEVRQNEQVLVTALSRSKKQAKVQPNSGRAGVMRVSQLDMSQPAPHSPPAPAESAGGLVGSDALGGTGD